MSEPSSLDILIGTKAILSADGAWTQGAVALDKNNQVVNPMSEDAVCFCLEGALVRAAGNSDRSTYYHASVAVQTSVPEEFIGNFVPTFNDHENTTVGDVIATLDRAIAKETARHEE